MNIQAGDIVNLSPGAVYYTGKEMPGWVKNDKWIVKSVEGDRAVLGKNESGTHEINSPVHIIFERGGYNRRNDAATGSFYDAATGNFYSAGERCFGRDERF